MSIKASSEADSAILYLATPYVPSAAYKCAIIAQGVSSWSRSKLHFCLDNTADNTYPTYNASVANARMTINYDGTVGIGNINPQQTLDVNGTIASTGYIYAGGTSTTGLRIAGSFDTGNTIYQYTGNIGITLNYTNTPAGSINLGFFGGNGYILSVSNSNVSITQPLIANTFYTTTYQNIIMRTIIIAPYTLTGSPYGNTAWLIDITEYNSQLGFTYLFVNINCSGHFYWLSLIHI